MVAEVIVMARDGESKIWGKYGEKFSGFSLFFIHSISLHI
jgi:hypothetical protein